MKSYLYIAIVIILTFSPLTAQNIPVNRELDALLIRGDYKRVIDTCKQILAYDSLNHGIYYRMGLAYQNTLEEDLSLQSFYKAVSLDPDNKGYNFMLAKAYYAREKYIHAIPLLAYLHSTDSTNWVYAYYLTSIYMDYGKYDEAINIYKKFLINDSLNVNYLNKLAFATLKKGDNESAARLYNKVLQLDERNILAIKNLAYLCMVAKESETAIRLLTRGIETDSTDMDLFARRAQIYFSINYNKRALDDYLVLLASGDSSEFNLKRAGIGYSNNMQPKVAIIYLLKAYQIDSTDYETCSYLGQCYFNLEDIKNSIRYYNRTIKILSRVNGQMALTYSLLAMSQKSDGLYSDAIASYLNSLHVFEDPTIYMVIANIYDENLKDSKRAILYYQKFLDNLKKSKGPLSAEYIESVRKRMEYLKENPVIK